MLVATPLCPTCGGKAPDAKPGDTYTCKFCGVTVKGVEVDVCKVHGTWFDAGEVRRIGEAFQSARIAMAGGATYNYAAAAAESRDNQRTAEAVMSVLGGILSALADETRSRR